MDQVVINDGVFNFYDVRNGGAFTLSQITTNQVKASSLDGPWQVDGSLVCQAVVLCGDGLPVTFSLSSGRVNPDGSTRVNAQVTPSSADLAGTLRTEGTVRREEDLLAYEGTFNFDKLVVPAAAASPPQSLEDAWSIAGGFRLDAEALTLQQFTWQTADGVFSVGGDAGLTLGQGASFTATLVSRQIDLDGALGEGDAASVADAGAEIWRRMADFKPPILPGHISLAVPAVIVSGSVLQNMQMEVHAEDGHWRFDSLQADLPGQTQRVLQRAFRSG